MCMICAIGAVGRFRVCAGLVEHAFAYDVPTIIGLIGTTVALNYFMNCFEDLPGSIFCRMSVGASGGPQNAKKKRKKEEGSTLRAGLDSSTPRAFGVFWMVVFVG